MKILFFACAVLALALPAHGQPQPYPAKPIRLIVPLAAGGGMDTTARGISQPLSERLKQTVVVDNRPGAGGAIGAELAAHADPDGYTLLMASASFVVHPLLYRSRYEPLRDFAPITQASRQPYVLIVHPSVPATTVKQFVAYAKAHPGKLSYASAGNGSLIHLTTELFKSATGIDIVHVPYKGMGATYADMLAGRIQTAFPSIISVLPHLKTGKLRALGVTSRTRAPTLPDTPTLQEAGIAGFEVTQWYGVLAPAHTPHALIARLQKEIAAALQLPEVGQRMAGDGSEPVGSTSAEFGAHIRAEVAKWKDVITRAKIRVD
ncbi:MAG TPA: tripartite tricarboxylate transporter substrate binding protein [Burkholderiales bacterium]|nr:tripartite tricarboxylate transporter substrate binding protein [Burkholderiales bacterium]